MSWQGRLSSAWHVPERRAPLGHEIDIGIKSDQTRCNSKKLSRLLPHLDCGETVPCRNWHSGSRLRPENTIGPDVAVTRTSLCQTFQHHAFENLNLEKLRFAQV